MEGKTKIQPYLVYIKLASDVTLKKDENESMKKMLYISSNKREAWSL